MTNDNDNDNENNNYNQCLTLTQLQQNKRVSYLGMCFLMLILSFSNLQNIFSTLCEQLGYQNLGQTSIFCIYTAALCSTPFTSVILKKIGYNKTFIICSLGYICFDMSGLILVKFNKIINHMLIRLIVCLGAACCGFCSSIIWVAQSGYITKYASENNKNKLFALFWSFAFSNQIISNSLGTFVLGKISNIAYFYLMTSLSFLSFVMFMFLPKVNDNDNGLGSKVNKPIEKSQSQAQPKTQSQTTIQKQLQKILTIIRNKKYKYLLMYMLLPGLSMAFYSTYLYKLIKLSIPQFDENISDVQQQQQPLQQSLQQQYNRHLNISEGIVFIIMGISQVLCGLAYRKYNKQYNKFNLASLSTIVAQIAGVLSLLCYFTKSYTLCFVVGILFGMCDIFMQTNTNVIVSMLFKDKVQGFAVNRVFYCIGVTAFLLMNMLLSGVDIWVFLVVFIVVQSVGTSVAGNLKYLGDGEEGEMIINNKDKDNNNNENNINNYNMSQQQKYKIVSNRQTIKSNTKNLSTNK